MVGVMRQPCLVPQVPIERYGYILLANEKWWKRLCSQNRAGKTIQAFVRRGLVGPKNTKLILFYVTHPLREIRGYATFIQRVTGDARDLWNIYSHEASLKSYREYLDLLQGRLKASFIRFKDLHELSTPIPARTISQLTGIERMPRSGTYISKEMAHELVRG